VGLAVGCAVPRYPPPGVLGVLGVAVAAPRGIEVAIGLGPGRPGDVGDGDGIGPTYDGLGAAVAPPRVGDGTGDAAGTGVDVEPIDGTGDGVAVGDDDSPAKPILTRPGWWAGAAAWPATANAVPAVAPTSAIVPPVAPIRTAVRRRSPRRRIAAAAGAGQRSLSSRS
jgi:hypothetical protein